MSQESMADLSDVKDVNSIGEGVLAEVKEIKAADSLVRSSIKDDEHENTSSATEKAQTMQYQYVWSDLFEKEKSQGFASRSKQAIIHISLTEERLKILEKGLENLKSIVLQIPEHERSFKDALKIAPSFQPGLKRSVQAEFRLTKKVETEDVHQLSALEALGQNVIPYHEQVEESGSLVSRKSTGICESPERLRIRSWPLRWHLTDICGDEILTVNYTEDDVNKLASTVLLRPFKLLAIYEKQIRESLENVRKRAEEEEESDAPPDTSFYHTNVYFLFNFKALYQDLCSLLEFMDVDLRQTFDLRKEIDAGTATEIEYADLWHLFKLGDIVVRRSDSEHAYQVVNFTGGREPLRKKFGSEEDRVVPLNGFVVDCCCLCFEGFYYKSVFHSFKIRKYHGKRHITSLEIYPLKFTSDKESTERRLLAQGRQYVSLTQSPYSHQKFSGRTLDQLPQQIDGQVIVDMTLAFDYNSQWKPQTGCSRDNFTPSDKREIQEQSYCIHGRPRCCGMDMIYPDLEMKCDQQDIFRIDYGGLFEDRKVEDLQQKDFLLMPPSVYAFVLRSRQWVTVPMAGLSSVSFGNNFEELMLPADHKKTVLALVETHERGHGASSEAAERSTANSLDIVKGKGAGLIILLHGEPGVGKTSTAECIADKTERPLFPITCGDIGETAAEVERNLVHNFRLAQKWGCVLLLDEADVFLAKRNKTDLRRNAVTSVFLRSLEYYSGILFLTTNRVGGIDPAFKSRVHLSLYYPRLELDAVLKLYEVFLRKTKEAMQRPGALQFRIKEDEIFSFAKRHHESLHKQGTWNGRQIRNAFQTAIALVEYDIIMQTSTSKKPSLGKKQFKVVAEASRKFDDYLIRTLQGFDDEIAAKDQWRNDQVHNVSIGAGRPSESESGSSESEAEEEKAVSPMGIAKGKSKEQDSGQLDKELFEEFRQFKMLREKYRGV